MSKKRAPGRSLDEWMELVTECRQSGLTDAAWCNEPVSYTHLDVYKRQALWYRRRSQR